MYETYLLLSCDYSTSAKKTIKDYVLYKPVLQKSKMFKVMKNIFFVTTNERINIPNVLQA